MPRATTPTAWRELGAGHGRVRGVRDGEGKQVLERPSRARGGIKEMAGTAAFKRHQVLQFGLPDHRPCTTEDCGRSRDRLHLVTWAKPEIRLVEVSDDRVEHLPITVILANLDWPGDRVVEIAQGVAGRAAKEGFTIGRV